MSPKALTKVLSNISTSIKSLACLCILSSTLGKDIPALLFQVKPFSPKQSLFLEESQLERQTEVLMPATPSVPSGADLLVAFSSAQENFALTDMVAWVLVPAPFTPLEICS